MPPVVFCAGDARTAPKPPSLPSGAPRIEEGIRMARRLTDKSAVLTRPRQKGWWGEPDEQELQPVAAPPDARRPAGRALHRPAVAVGRALTPSQIDSIRAVMRLFIDDDVARGVDPRLTLL